MDPKAAIVLKGLGHQFAQGGTDALETPALWEVPEIKLAGGLNALMRGWVQPAEVMHRGQGKVVCRVGAGHARDGLVVFALFRAHGALLQGAVVMGGMVVKDERVFGV